MSRIEFRLPDVGEGLSEGEIVRWLVSVGDTVTRDQTVVEIETDKSLVELPAPQDGTVVELGGEEGDVLPVGELLLVLETADTAAVAAAAPADESPAADAPVSNSERPASDRPAQSGAEAPAPASTSPSTSDGRRAKAAPAVRKLAVEHGVDLQKVVGSGPSGRISKDDVLASLERGDPAPAAETETALGASRPAPTGSRAGGEDRVEPLRGLRRQIAKTMTTAWQQVPHITDVREVDATGLVAARQRLATALAGEVERFTYLPLMIRAVTETLRSSPKFNASIDMDNETITYRGRFNIGLAAATDDGLIVPVIHDADQLGLAEIARRVDELGAGARARSLSPQQMRDGTCTITNFGSFGGWIATPIIRPPEAAIVGFGRIRDQVVAVDGQAVVRPTLPISVSADHRLIDGDDMGAFLNRLTELLQDPILMLAGGR